METTVKQALEHAEKWRTFKPGVLWQTQLDLIVLADEVLRLSGCKFCKDATQSGAIGFTCAACGKSIPMEKR